jgi:hypothetical protein
MLHLEATGSVEPVLSKLALLSLVIRSSSSVTQPISENHLTILSRPQIGWVALLEGLDEI